MYLSAPRPSATPIVVDVLPSSFGWNEIGVIVSIVCMFLTVGALYAAIEANKKATCEIIETKRIQEQTVSISLNEVRMRILIALKTLKFVDSTEFEVYFSVWPETIKKYQQYLETKKLASEYESALGEYKRIMTSMDGLGGADHCKEYQAILDAEQRTYMDTDDDSDKEFIDLCTKYDHSHYDPLTEQYICLNYATLSKNLNEAEFQITEQRKAIITDIEDIIIRSIQPLK